MSPMMYEPEKADDNAPPFPHIDDDPNTLPRSLDPFTVTTSTGFLPFLDPVTELPKTFSPLVVLLEDLPIVKADGSPGLLASYQLGPTVDQKHALPNLTADIDDLITSNGKPDLAAVTAAFRDYAFLASAYLLEPCWKCWNEDHDAGYGLGRQTLPQEIAGPLVKTAAMLDIPPFMAYAAAYSSYNYRFADPSKGTSDYNNLHLIRAFERGLDPKSSEAGFVLTHVDMVKHSPQLIQGTMQILTTLSKPSPNRNHINTALSLLDSAMTAIESSMETMWPHSLPKDYLSYRTFIFGITNQSMFPHGVVYAGHNENKPLSFRGESGANDSMIPLLDSLLEIPMPANPLTEILKDFRSYRPKPHREFLAWVREEAVERGVREFCTEAGASETTVLYLRVLDHVRSFRWRHWLFAREYIIKRSKHPTATGGSPIVTWLPNQLMAVMDLMVSTYEGMAGAERNEKAVVEMMGNVKEQREKLDKEVRKYCQERGA